MADLEALRSLLRAAAVVHGEQVVEDLLTAVRVPPGQGTSALAPSPRARRSRPPERFSPDRGLATRRRSRSPRRDPPAAGAQVSSPGERSAAGRNPRGGRSRPEGGLVSTPPPPSSSTRTRAAVSRASAGGRARRVTSAGGDRPSGALPGPLPAAAHERAGSDAAGTSGAAGTTPRRGSGLGRKRPAEDGAGGSPSGRRVRGTVGAAASPGEGAGGSSAEEGLCSQDDADGPPEDAGPAAADLGRPPTQPGEQMGFPPSMGGGSGVNASGAAVLGPGGVESLGGAVWGQLIGLLQQLVGGRPGAAGPTGVWVGADASVSQGSGGTAVPAVPTAGPLGEVESVPAEPIPVGGGAPEGSEAGAKGKEKEKAVDIVRLDDRAKGEVYICFEGPLGAHLKQEVREKIWKGEYMEIFSLLPLDKFNLDKVKPSDSKKEDEEKRRYRLIPRTFVNWLQAFAILASVIGEKEPEHCSALFGYMDSIGEAHRVYGGVAWLRYDEQFRQRKAVRPGLRWDHKDISLWMRLMSAPAAPSFRGGAGNSGSTTGSSASQKKGYCWLFNEGQCKFGVTCRFKHECSGCGGGHGLNKCFKRGKGKGGDVVEKREDAGEGRSNASFSK